MTLAQPKFLNQLVEAWRADTWMHANKCNHGLHLLCRHLVKLCSPRTAVAFLHNTYLRHFDEHCGERYSSQRRRCKRGGLPDSLLLQGREVNLLVVSGGKVAGEVAIVVHEGWVVLKAGEGAVLVAAVSGLVDLVGDLPDALLGQHLHQVLQQFNESVQCGLVSLKDSTT